MADDTPDGNPTNPEIPTNDGGARDALEGAVQRALADAEPRLRRLVDEQIAAKVGEMRSQFGVPEGFTVRATDPAPKAVPTDDPGFIDQRRQLVGVGIPGHVADDFHRKGVPLAGVLKVVQEFRDVPETATIITRLLAHLTERPEAATTAR
jgi:hypothetical protein